MFGLSSGAPAGGSLYLTDAPDTLAGVAQHGGNGFSGMVPAGTPIHTDPSAGGRQDDTGHHVVLTSPQPTSDLAPYAGVTDRPVYGGVRTSHHERLLVDGAPYDGSHIELRNRVSVVILAPHEQMEAPAPDVLPSLRVPPVSDPYGRACANARAVAARR